MPRYVLARSSTRGSSASRSHGSVASRRVPQAFLRTRYFFTERRRPRPSPAASRRSPSSVSATKSSAAAATASQRDGSGKSSPNGTTTKPSTPSSSTMRCCVDVERGARMVEPAASRAVREHTVVQPVGGPDAAVLDRAGHPCDPLRELRAALVHRPEDTGGRVRGGTVPAALYCCPRANRAQHAVRERGRPGEHHRARPSPA